VGSQGFYLKRAKNWQLLFGDAFYRELLARRIGM
jgi:hypothetical protein